MKIRLTKDLEPLRVLALGRLNDVIGERIYARTGSPVAIVRARKAAEAERWRAGCGAGPLLHAEAVASGQPVASLVDGILAKAAEEMQGLAQIEARRQAAQAAIRSAPHPAAIEAVLEEILNG